MTPWDRNTLLYEYLIKLCSMVICFFLALEFNTTGCIILKFKIKIKINFDCLEQNSMNR